MNENENRGFIQLQSFLLNGKVRIFLGIALLAYLWIEAQGKGDYYIFSLASQDLFKGGNIYENTYVDGYHYFYSVLFAVILYPFTFLPFVISKFLWLCLNAFLAYRIFSILKNLLPLNGLSMRQLMIFQAIVLIFSFRFVFENIHYSQITILILYLAVEGLRQVFRNKPLQGAALIALGINIKLLPIVLLPYLFYRGFFKAGFLTIIFWIAFMLLPALVLGWQHNQALLGTWAALVNPLNEGHVLDTGERSFHALSTLLSTLLVKNVPDVYAMPIKRNIADIPPEKLGLILNIVRLTLIAFSLYFFRSLPFRAAQNNEQRFREMSYLLMLIPLIFPHQQHYAFLFICPAFMFCVFYLMRYKASIPKGKYKSMLICCVIIYLLCGLKILLGEFNPYYEHFKILTYGALWLIVILALCEPVGKPATSAA